MPVPMLDEAFTRRDHALRDEDVFAQGKYEITGRWLRPYIGPGTTLANVGCGSGAFNEIALRLGARVLACEPDPYPYGLARARSGDRITLENVGVVEFAESGARAQLVVMHDVLEHVEDEAAAVDALDRILLPGGRGVVSVPAVPALYGYHDEALGHRERYSKRGLRRALERRFTIERLRYYGFFSLPIALYYSRLARRPYPLAAVNSGSFLRDAFASVCRLETRVGAPLGVSLIAQIVKR